MSWFRGVEAEPTLITNSRRKIFSLSAGVHKLIIRGREAGTQLGKITISPAAAAAQPQPPANLRVLSAQ